MVMPKSYVGAPGVSEWDGDGEGVCVALPSQSYWVLVAAVEHDAPPAHQHLNNQSLRIRVSPK